MKDKYPIILKVLPDAEKANERILNNLLADLQDLAAEWQNCKLGVMPENIQDFIHSPEKVIKQAILREISDEIPQGTRFPVDADKYIQTLNLPDTSDLVSKANKIKNRHNFSKQALNVFTIADDVIIKNSEKAKNFVEKDNLFAYNEKDLVLYHNLEACAIMFSEMKLRPNTIINQVVRWNGLIERYEFVPGHFHKFRNLMKNPPKKGWHELEPVGGHKIE